MNDAQMLAEAKEAAKRSFRAQEANARLGHALNGMQAVVKGLERTHRILEREIAKRAALEQALEAVDALLKTLREQEAEEVRKSAERRPVKKSAGCCRCGGLHGEPDWTLYGVNEATGEIRVVYHDD